jgi:hypothetical protein
MESKGVKREEKSSAAKETKRFLEEVTVRKYVFIVINQSMID